MQANPFSSDLSSIFNYLAASRATCGRALCVLADPPSPARARAEADEGQAPRSSRAPPPARHPSPREERALESFGGEWRPEGAAAAAGRGRWRLVAPERRDWGGWAGSGGGGRGRDGGRDRHGQ